MRDLWGNEIDDLPQRRRTDATNADRQARFVAQRSDLGELPSCADPARRERCRNDPVAFGCTYCGSMLKRPPPPPIVEYVVVLRDAILLGGLVHVRLPRGTGKTTWIKIVILWAVSYGYLKYPVVFQAGAALGAAILEDLWTVIEGDDTYLADFPEVAVPVRALEGMPQRAAGQHYHGQRTRIRRTATQICLPVIEGSAASGAVIVSKGAGSACRGMVRGSMRPDFVLLDDVQTRNDAASDARTRKLTQWIQQDVMGLAGDAQLAGAMASTPIRPGDLSDVFADRGEHPEWRLVEHRLVESWPAREDLWEEYDSRWALDMAGGDTDLRSATAWYQAHREDMDAGADCIDPRLYDPRMERSAIQHARNLLLRLGREAFQAEYQLAPAKEDASLTVEAADVKRALNGSARGHLPPGTLEVVGFVDVMADQLHWAALAVGPHQVAAVIDYGVFPERGRATPANAPDRDIEAALARALLSLGTALLGRRFRRADGRETRLHALWFDCGWRTRVTNGVAALLRRRGFPNVYGCKGFSAAYYNNGVGKHVVARGVNVDFREADGVRWAAQNSDVWKEAAQRGFLGVPLAPGSVSVWGDDGAAHHEFATQISAERLADKATSARGLDMYRWTLKPGAANHYLDALAGCLAMASWYRFWDASDVVVGAARAVRESGGAIAAPMRRTTARRARVRYRSARAR